jgi:mannitol-1-phosphate/altronate dehydrogenase
MIMLNPADLFGSGSDLNLRSRILQRLRSEKINDQVIGIIRNGVEKFIYNERIVLSGLEKKHLLSEVIKSVLAEMSRQLDEA